MPGGRPRRVALAVRTWASEESVFVWNWASKYFIETGHNRDWLYIVHINTGRDKGDWKASGPVIADLDRSLQGYSYNVVELQGDEAAKTLVQWVEEEAIDVLVVSTGRPKRSLNPISSRTTDYICSHSPCATLVIHPKMNPADLERVHAQQGSTRTGVDERVVPVTACRRVAFAHQNQEVIHMMTQWASVFVSRPDDIEFQLLVNQRSIMTRLRQATKSPVTNFTSAFSGTQSGLGNTPGASVFDAETSLSGEVAAGPDEAPMRTELMGQPQVVIKKFISEHHIDLLVVPVVASSVLKRMDKRDAKEFSQLSASDKGQVVGKATSVYHKAQCTCLCVPVHLLRRQDGDGAMPGGLLLSEDDLDDEDSRAGRPTASAVTPRRTIAVAPTFGSGGAGSGGAYGPRSPSSGHHATSPTRAHSLSSANALGAYQNGRRALSVGGGAAVVDASGPSGDGGPGRAGEDAASMDKGLFSSLRNRITTRKSASRDGPGVTFSNRQLPRDGEAKTHGDPVINSGTMSSAASTTVAAPTLDDALAMLHSVLCDGGLSADMRQQGAAAIARARVALSALTLEAAQLRAQADDSEARIAAAVAALQGAQPPGTPRLRSAMRPARGSSDIVSFAVDE